MRPAKASPEAIGDGLVAAFRQGGFSGASLADLKLATGLNPASLYYRFANGKVDMALAALDHAGSSFAALVLEPLAGAAEPRVRLSRSAEGVATFYAGGELACLLAIMALSDAPPGVLDRVRSMFDLWRDALAATLAEAGVACPRDVATDRIGAIHGALIMGRAGLGTGGFDRAVERLGES